MPRRTAKPLKIAEVEKIKALVASGKTYHAVAVEIGRDPKTVKKYATEPETAREIEVIREDLADWYEDLSRRMLRSITDEDISKINAQQRTVSSAICTDKMRLLRDQSTQNLSIRDAVLQLDAEIIKTAEVRRQIEAELAEDEDCQ